MIVKIKQTNKSDGWFIFDNAEGVAYSRHPNARAFFHDSMGCEAPINEVGYVGDDLHRTQGSFFDRTEVSQGEPSLCGWYISFDKGPETFEFWGDTDIYLLNDNGKTIERIF